MFKKVDANLHSCLLDDFSAWMQTRREAWEMGESMGSTIRVVNLYWSPG
jgi:hypothetical protein